MITRSAADRLYTASVHCAARGRLGPTGRHIRDLLPKAPPPKVEAPRRAAFVEATTRDTQEKAKPKPKEGVEGEDSEEGKKAKGGKFKEYRDVKPTKVRSTGAPTFDSRARQGLRLDEEQQHWRRRRPKGGRQTIEPVIVARRLLRFAFPSPSRI